MNPADPPYRPRLRRRLLLAFGSYALFVSATFIALAFTLAYVVEDRFFTQLLADEAAHQRQQHAATGRWAPPRAPGLRLHAAGAGLPEDLRRARAQRPAATELAGDDGRHYHLHALHADGTLLVAEVGGQLAVRPLRDTLLGVLAAGAGALLLVALALGAWLAWRIAAPLQRLAAQLAEGHPARLPVALAQGLRHDEIGRLARHLDALHARTQAFIERERAFSRDASHELRTPLAVLALALEQLQARADAAQRPPLDAMQAAVAQLQHTVDLLLALAREETPQTAAPPQPLLPQVEGAVLALAPLLERQGIALDLDVPPALTRPWPPALTRLLLGNLLANALAHRQSAQIRIHADAAMLCVANASAPPPPALLVPGAAGQQAGLKGEASAGFGLGLHIVRRLAERHGLALALHHRDGWTEACLHDAGAPPRGTG